MDENCDLGAKEPPNKRSRMLRPESSVPETAVSSLALRHPDGWRAYIQREKGAPVGYEWVRHMGRHVRALGKRVSGVFGRFYWVSPKPRIRQGPSRPGTQGLSGLFVLSYECIPPACAWNWSRDDGRL